jgi:hypothetical protein
VTTAGRILKIARICRVFTVIALVSLPALMFGGFSLLGQQRGARNVFQPVADSAPKSKRGGRSMTRVLFANTRAVPSAAGQSRHRESIAPA